MLATLLVGGWFLSPLAAAPAKLSATQILAEIAVSPETRATPTRFFDHAYVFPDHRWLTEVYVPYFRTLVQNWQSQQAARPSSQLLASLFKSQLGVSNAQGGRAQEGEVACALLRSHSGEDGILVRTEQGWFRFDPVSDELEPWAAVADVADVRSIEF